MATLVPCPSCARHVKATESTCPFCDAVVLAKPRVLEPMPADRLLARTALSFAAAAATTLAGCGKETADKPPEPPVNVAPAYGVPIVDQPPPAPAPSARDAAVPPSPPETTTAPPVAPAYGVPPINRGPKK